MTYDILLACIRSGQLAGAQLQSYLDHHPHFAAWYKAQLVR